MNTTKSAGLEAQAVSNGLSGRFVKKNGAVFWAVSALILAAGLASQSAQAQVKIGDNPTTINPGSALEVESTNRGVLVTRVALTDRTTWGLNGNRPVDGMVVYNTAASTGTNGLQQGLAVWKNGQWISVDESPYFHTNSTETGNSTLANSGATGANSIAVGPNAKASGAASVAVGLGADAGGADSIAVGTGAAAAPAQAVALGAGSSVTQAGGVALGAGSVASTAAGVAGYVPPTATDAQRIAIGATTSTLAAVSVGDAANGQFRQITGLAAGTADSDAVNVSQLRGVQGQVSAIDQSALKYDANADGSVNYNNVTMGGGNATGPVTVHNVAPGVAGTDAVNVNQLNSGIAGANAYTDARVNAIGDELRGIAKDASAGTAGAMAMAGIPQAYLPGKSMLAAGVAGYGGEAALAIGMSKLSDNGRWVVKFSGSANSRGKVGISAGAGFHW